MSNKSSKTELVAIYRLEFYKKQKNWKLSSSRIKTSRKPTERDILNATYNIEEKPQKINQSDPLNVAFVDSDSDKNQLIPPPRRRELSQEWQEPINIWPEINNNATGTVKATMNTKQRLANLQRAASLVDLEKNNGLHSPKCNQMLPTCTECPQTSYAACPQDLGVMAWNDCGDFDANWPMETAVWIGAGHMAQDLGASEGVDVLDGHEDVYSSHWPPVDHPDEQPLTRDMEWDTSVDSVGEFMRGADMAPHSSEIDLSLPNCVKGCDVSFTSLSRLSSQQLLEAARQHSRVLRRLLLESETRQKLKSAQTLSTANFSYEEFPTRDCGPSVQLGQDVFFRDVVISGSHGSAAGAGRGRGRLGNNSFGLKPFSR